MKRLAEAGRLLPQKNALRYMRRLDDFPAYILTNVWTDLGGASSKRYVVETAPKIIERCVLMVTDPGDLVWEPFGGLCTAAVASLRLGRRCEAAEIDPEFYGLAIGRLANCARKTPSDFGQS